MSRPIVLLLGQPFNTYMPVKNRQTGSGVARIWRYGGQRGSGGRVPSGVQGQSPWWGVRGRSPSKAHSIIRIFGCETVHNFVYLAKLHEPQVKREKT